ncbi:hypothetical protein [Pseudorhodoferax sp. Leaf267]|uniref:hypothetical protein n=1 Tax=Pseudorhodoferax sp. Leaf267 TaxID=1736316 RepID=UPI0006FAC6F1|nr:hypothetical protein [Pseudorhodoferax sp. Leaf267]KQP20566.1 hypothetical protein ASF43_27465 [Pseudorhodoferax sp. Leaf267]
MTSITKTERPLYDEYTGKLDDLIAAGLVRTDQLPPLGKASVSYSHGSVQRRRCPMDEHYLRVVRNLDGTWSVQVGITAQIAAPRKAAQRAASAARERERQARWNKQERARKQVELDQAAALARRNLASVIKSETAYRRYLVGRLREMTTLVTDSAAEPATWHGYRLTEESRDAIVIATDALAEAVLQADVIFDQQVHDKIIASYRATIRAADPSFAMQLSALVQPNPAILQGEAS